MSKLPGATVLILVLVEDGLGGMMQKNISATFISLNPCFSGGWSRSTNHQAMERVCNVLILVLVEDGLGDNYYGQNNRNNRVLILVLVEDGLGVATVLRKEYSVPCLNPCFSGGWSRSKISVTRTLNNGKVLILVLVEDGLGASKQISRQLVT